MADTAFQVMYRDEWTRGFERNQATLRASVTTEAMVKGRQATFLVATTNREAVTRGSNGLIPAASDNLEQPVATLEEKHDKPQKTNFNIFAGQSNQREILQSQSRGVINRDIDNVILAMLNTGTVFANANASILTKNLMGVAKTKLWNANVPADGNVYAAITPSAWDNLENDPSFSSADYVSTKPVQEGIVRGPNVEGGPQWKFWGGVWYTQHTGLPGVGTNLARCFLWHKAAIGHAYDRNDIMAMAGYNEEDDYSWARTTIYHGAVKLQNAGIVIIRHDDSLNS